MSLGKSQTKSLKSQLVICHHLLHSYLVQLATTTHLVTHYVTYTATSFYLLATYFETQQLAKVFIPTQ